MRSFKERFYEHKMAFKNEKSGHQTALSRHIWKLKKAGKNFDIKWRIKARAPTYKSGSHKCMLCLKEKSAISLCPPKQLINKRTELLSKCIHRFNFELRNCV